MEESSSFYEASRPQASVVLGDGDNYVMSLANLASGYAASASSPSNKIVLLDKRYLRPIRTFPGHELATTSIQAVNCVVGKPNGALISTGKDGSVKVWDERTGSHAIKLTRMGDDSIGILCSDVSSDGNLVAAGTELQGSDAFIVYWDPRQPASPSRMHSSTHSEDITTVSFHPTALSPSLILSGSSDGLLSISNAEEKDEDEAVMHVSSWGASVSQAGWYYGSDATSPAIWAASDMETFSLWTDELEQRLSLDIRSPSVHTRSRTWVTDYLIGCAPYNDGLRVYTGSNEGDAALITPPSISSSDPNVNGLGTWQLQSIWAGHHAGIVRSILPDHENQVVVTGGEDGKINLWKDSPIAPISSSSNNGSRMDVDGDTNMDSNLKLWSPSSPNRRKRDHDEDEVLEPKKLRSQ